ncbi:Hpt domain-containing protein [Terasakiella sp. A23]|uniref:Hpt domain-containing protein n=1 Tax=Terasakiella sp. FCG-A23 TaxID=3080561 RepID=UPI002955C7C3|nr:Hpt domain-containing protein [Terasakiella sp. A23]MDV7338703.1 Hpt domain-containing protein [Terasakiella sp. A23]
MDEKTRQLLKKMEKDFQIRLQQTAADISGWESADRFEQLMAVCHKLAGSSGTFGFDETSRVLKAFEQKLKMMEPPKTDEEARVLYQEAARLIATEV